MSRFETNLRIFWALLLRDVYLLQQMLFDNIIDSSIIVCIVYFVYGHLLPLIGISNNILLPTFVGTIVVVMMNVAFDRAIIDASDFEFSKFIDYQRTLPISINWLMAKYITSYVIDLTASSLPILIIGRLIIGPALVIAQPLLFLVIFLLGMIFMSLLVFILAIGKDFRWFRENTWPRVLLPMVTLGALYYPLKPLVATLPWAKWIVMAVPMAYIVEGLRHAIGTEAYIPAVWCIVALSMLIIIFMFLLNRAVRKRIDPL